MKSGEFGLITYGVQTSCALDPDRSAQLLWIGWWRPLHGASAHGQHIADGAVRHKGPPILRRRQKTYCARQSIFSLGMSSLGLESYEGFVDAGQARKAGWLVVVLLAIKGEGVHDKILSDARDAATGRFAGLDSPQLTLEAPFQNGQPGLL